MHHGAVLQCGAVERSDPADPNQKEEQIVDAIKVAEYARALYSTHGDRAEAEVAQKMRDCESAGKADEAEDWKAVRQAIRQLRGPNQG